MGAPALHPTGSRPPALSPYSCRRIDRHQKARTIVRAFSRHESLTLPPYSFVVSLPRSARNGSRSVRPANPRRSTGQVPVQCLVGGTLPVPVSKCRLLRRPGRKGCRCAGSQQWQRWWGSCSGRPWRRPERRPPSRSERSRRPPRSRTGTDRPGLTRHGAEAAAPRVPTVRLTSKGRPPVASSRTPGRERRLARSSGAGKVGSRAPRRRKRRHRPDLT